MVKLRLTRMGSINKPFYRIVAVDSRARRDGKYLDNVGYYDPKHDPAVINIDEAKAIKWLKVGAQPTETVNSLFRKAGILKKWHEIRYLKKDVPLNSISVEPVDENPVISNEEPILKPKKPRTKKVKEEKTDLPIIEEAPAIEEALVTEDITVVGEKAVVEETQVSEETPEIETPAETQSIEPEAEIIIETPEIDDNAADPEKENIVLETN